jgi:hypothetical protein
VTVDELLRLRLRHQRLLASSLSSPIEVVSALGAVQSQDFPSACWAVVQRARGLAEADVVRALDEGTIVRTHVLRPTWHFVAPKDLRWMLALTGPRVQAIATVYHRHTGIDRRMLARSKDVLARELEGGRYRTRPELAAAFKRARLPVEPLRVSFLVMDAELDGLVCSGPRRAKRFTYALVHERVPAAVPLDRDAAVAELARRYFSSHGPATLRDFAWWSGLTQRDGKAGLDQLGEAFESSVVDGVTFWYPSRVTVPRARRQPVARLLPNFDEYLVSYRDRGPTAGPSGRRFPPGFQHSLVIDGRIAGAWRRSVTTREVQIAVMPGRRLSRAEIEAVESAAAHYARFADLPVRLHVSGTTRTKY